MLVSKFMSGLPFRLMNTPMQQTSGRLISFLFPKESIQNNVGNDNDTVISCQKYTMSVRHPHILECFNS